MPDKDIVLAKVAAIQRCLRRIKDGTGLDPALLDELDAQDIFVLNLQRAIQSAIDLGTHVIASEGLGIPETIRGNFILLEHAKIITKTLSGEMGEMGTHPIYSGLLFGLPRGFRTKLLSSSASILPTKSSSPKGVPLRVWCLKPSVTSEKSVS